MIIILYDSRYFPDIFQIFSRYFSDIFIYSLYMLYDLYTQITYNSNYDYHIMIPDIFQIFCRYFSDIFIYSLYMLYDLYTQITYNSNYYILKIDILKYTYINVCIIL